MNVPLAQLSRIEFKDADIVCGLDAGEGLKRELFNLLSDSGDPVVCWVSDHNVLIRQFLIPKPRMKLYLLISDRIDPPDAYLLDWGRRKSFDLNSRRWRKFAANPMFT